MAGLGGALGGGGALTQIFTWAVAQQIVQTMLSPTLELVAQRVNSENPVVDLSPADLAAAVVQSFMSHDDAAHEAAKSGIDGGRFSTLVNLAGDSLAPEGLAEALRRGLIPEHGSGADSTSFEQGIREGRLKNKWAGIVKELAIRWPTPVDALEALLEGQISEGDARTLYERFGGDPAYFAMLFNTRGNAPTPVEALELANRGVIPWRGTGASRVSYEQAFLEGPWRNKWLEPFIALGEYLPPPRTITAMVRNGSLSDARALDLLIKTGLAKDLAAAYIADAHHQKTQTERDLSVSQLLSMYESGLISPNDAKSLLLVLGYSDESAGLMIDYKDLQRAIGAVNSAVSRIHALYVAHKIGRDTARNGLVTLAIPAAQIDDIVSTWDLERSINVRVLTPAEIANAWKYEIISIDEALAELVALGYTPRDAWIYMSVHAKAPLPTPPPPGPAPIQHGPKTGSAP